MTKLRDIHREEIRTLILICRARGFNSRQTTEFINKNLKTRNSVKRLSQSYIQRTIKESEAESNTWLHNLTVGKTDYIIMFKDIIDSLHVEQNELWDLIDKKRESDAKYKENAMIKAYSEIHSISRTLWDMYKDIPLLMSGPTNKNITDNIVFEDTTSVYPKISTSSRFTTKSD